MKNKIYKTVVHLEILTTDTPLDLLWLGGFEDSIVENSDDMVVSGKIFSTSRLYPNMVKEFGVQHCCEDLVKERLLV